jgi:hypothetical protein
MATAASQIQFDEGARLRAGSAVSWGAILAGSAVAVALSLVLVTLGAGLGFASLSAEPGRGASAGAFSVVGAIWLIVTQWFCAGVGGYVAGRLRNRWLATHWHESYFRDTAHGLTVWAVASLATAALLAGSIGHLAGGAMHAGMAMRGEGPPPGAMGPGGGPAMPEIDRLLRPSAAAAPVAPGPDARGEVMRLLADAPRGAGPSDEDRQYLAQVVATRTGVTAAEARQRVDAFLVQARQAAETARKAAAQIAIWTALSMLIGAFIASVAARLGGHTRDEHL